MTSSATGVVFDALDRAGCRPHGREDYFRARCPAHDSNSPSLGVKEGHEGRALLKCLVGCPVDAIVAALGLEMRDLFPANEPGRRSTPAPPRLEERARIPRNPAEAVLQQLCALFGEDAYRSTENRRVWTGRCPVCEADRLVVVEDEHDPLDPDGDVPQVRVSCIAGCASVELHAKLGAA